MTFEEDGDDDLELDEDGEFDFAEPGQASAMLAATRDNPRSFPCPSCGREGKLTALDLERGHQCDRCARAAEGGGP
jgi:hypothetical protein